MSRPRTTASLHALMLIALHLESCCIGLHRDIYLQLGGHNTGVISGHRARASILADWMSASAASSVALRDQSNGGYFLALQVTRSLLGLMDKASDL